MHPIVALAATQHGVVTTAQLLDAGVGRRSIARRVEAGWLVPLHRGVFQVGPTTSTWGLEMAAVLACGDGAALSHQSAAAVWGFGKKDRVIHVTAPARRRSRNGIRVHRTLSLDAAVQNGLPLTRPAQTLNDLRGTLTRGEYERAEERAAMLGLVVPDDDSLNAGFTRSEAERRLRTLVEAAGLPRPRMNARVAGYEVDAFWPAQRLIVEVDGWAYHRTREAFERDRRKDFALQAAGYKVVRITYRRLRDDAFAVAAELAVLLRLE